LTKGAAYGTVGKTTTNGELGGEATPFVFLLPSPFLLRRIRSALRFHVPPLRRTKIAWRKPYKVRAIFDRYLGWEQYSVFIVTAVSQFEGFLSEVLRLVFLEHPN
jgi:hypothetical protein